MSPYTPFLYFQLIHRKTKVYLKSNKHQYKSTKLNLSASITFLTILFSFQLPLSTTIDKCVHHWTRVAEQSPKSCLIVRRPLVTNRHRISGTEKVVINL
ncbi:hypothetical protein Hanom_Chr09g00849141 [Helianthus anomalus]